MTSRKSRHSRPAKPGDAVRGGNRLGSVVSKGHIGGGGIVITLRIETRVSMAKGTKRGRTERGTARRDGDGQEAPLASRKARAELTEVGKKKPHDAA